MAQTALLGQSIHIKGELSGNEDLTIEGTVEGKVDLKDHHLTIGKGGRIKADLHARMITIVGEVWGRITAEEKVELLETARLHGDIITPRLSIADGAQFKGSVDMDRKAGTKELLPHDESSVHGRAPQRMALPA